MECPICGGGLSFLWQEGNVKVYKCKDCGRLYRKRMKIDIRF